MLTTPTRTKAHRPKKQPEKSETKTRQQQQEVIMYTLTGSVEALSLGYIIHTAIDGNKYPTVWLFSVVLQQFRPRKVPPEAGQFRFRWGSGRRLLLAAEDFVHQNGNDPDQDQVQRAVDDLVEDASQETNLFVGCRDFRNQIFVGHTDLWQCTRFGVWMQLFRLDDGLFLFPIHSGTLFRESSIIIIQGKEAGGTDLEDDAYTTQRGTKRIFTPPEKHAHPFSLYLPISQAGIGIR